MSKTVWSIIPCHYNSTVACILLKPYHPIITHLLKKGTDISSAHSFQTLALIVYLYGKLVSEIKLQCKNTYNYSVVLHSNIYKCSKNTSENTNTLYLAKYLKHTIEIMAIYKTTRNIYKKMTKNTNKTHDKIYRLKTKISCNISTGPKHKKNDQNKIIIYN